MDIHLLKASITEKDLNDLLQRFLPDDVPVENLRLQVVDEGIRAQGAYPMFININFETLWEVSVVEGRVAARLAQFKAMGMPAGIFRSAILKFLEDAVRNDDSLQLDGDTVRIDVDRLLAREGFTARTKLKSIQCQAGVLVIEGGV